MRHNLNFTRRGFISTVIAVSTSAAALAVSPVAAANVAANAAGCLPLNGTQISASSHENANFGITYDSTVTYWYQDGAVNWHKTLDGGRFNLTHDNTSGAIPAAPGSIETVPGTGGSTSPIFVTVCKQ
ncbi:hypothetical protein [Mycobacterium sp.]|uniref:hypothetical protein n=1 Tax=Mycobacterium sp. TaxID=1785 RepID=UPI0031E46342